MIALGLWGLLAVSGSLAGSTILAYPATYRSALQNLRSGDVLALSPGVYEEGLPIRNLFGEPGRRIVIAGPAEGPPAILRGRAGNNTVSLRNAAYVTIRDLVLDGQGLAVDGVKAEGSGCDWTHQIKLERLTIQGHGSAQHIVGISSLCPAWNWEIRGNTIIGAGTGMYLGNSDGTAPFVGGLIEHNVIVDSIGYNMQIKHQVARPQVEGMPKLQTATIVRHNVFSKGIDSSIGRDARPNVLIGHLPVAGPGSDDDYLIYGNFFYQNPAEALFQGEGNLALYDNVFINRFGSAIVIQPHHDRPRTVRIFHNTILAARTGISFSGASGDYEQMVSGNIVFAPVPLGGLDTGGNLTGPPDDAGRYLAKPDDWPGMGLELTPASGNGAGVRGTLPWLLHAGLDFDGNPRAATDIGAYATVGTKRWPLQLSRKPLSDLR